MNDTLRRLVPTALALCLHAAFAHAAPPTEGRHFSSSNANLFVAASDPVCPTTLLAGSDAALLRSLDAGLSWHSLPSPVRATFSSLIFDPPRRQFILAGSEGTLLRGRACGEQWQLSEGIAPLALRRLLQVDAATGVLLAAGENGQLLRSADAGHSWQNMASPVRAYLAHLLRHTRSGILLAGGARGTLLRSNDGGLKWQTIRGLPRGDVSHLAELASGHLLVSFSSGEIYRSGDQGRRWQKTRIPHGQAVAVINAIAQNKRGLIAAASQDGRILLSPDNGLSWLIAPSGTPHFFSSILATSDDEFIVAGAQGSLLRSRAQGRQWQQVLQAGNAEFETLTRLPGGELLAAGGGGLIARSQDEGYNWQIVRHGVHHYTHALALAPELLLAAGVNGHLALSRDDGQSWTPVAAPDTVYFFTALHHPPSNSLLAAGSNGTLMRSSDGGRNWQTRQIAGDATLSHLRLLSTGRILALSNARGILYSDDAGENWHNSDADSDTIWLSIDQDPHSGVILAIGREDRIARSHDNGQHWEYLPAGLGKGLTRIRQIDGVFLASGQEGSILRSTDQGRSFEKIMLPEFTVINDFAPIPGLADGLLAVGSKGRILRSDDKGLSWQSIPSGSSDLLRVIAFDPAGRRMLIAGRGGAILQSEDLGLSWSIAHPAEATRYTGSVLNPATNSLFFWGDRILRLGH